MGIASYTTRLRVSGTPTAMTNEVMNNVDGGGSSSTHWEIDAAARSVWDRGATLNFVSDVGGTNTAISSTAVADINYLFGRVKFKSAQTDVGVSGNYLPMADVAGANSYTLTMETDALDDTDYSSTGFRSRNMGIHNASVSVTRWDNVDTSIADALLDTTVQPVMVLDVQPGGPGNPSARMFVVPTSDSRSGDVGSLESVDTNFELTGNTYGAFAWSDL